MPRWLPLLSLAGGLCGAGQVDTIRGYSPEQSAQRKALEVRLRKIPEAARIRSHMERMAAGPHHAGSPGARAVAEYALQLFRQWGYDAHIETFEALLPYPTLRRLEVLGPRPFRASLMEPAIAGDPASGAAPQLPPFNAYAASGDVTGELLYVNYGLPEDYDWLSRKGISARGRIVIARYGKGWRGTKVKVAAERGALACILYSDPREDGYFQGDAYPAGPHRPATGVQRGSVLDMPVHAGDPLSPGWASEPGARRLSREQAATLAKIPVLPVSSGEAQALLEQLEGLTVPETWRGALGLTYHTGPGPARVRLQLEFDWSTRPVRNVVATMRGRTAPDEWLLYGNHHDAWVTGANDPLSGASALLETARSLAELRKSGWSPERTIKFALWDGEEFGLIGSTEWVEKHRQELDRKLVVYLNSDSTGAGRLEAGGSHLLDRFVTEALGEFRDPVTGKPLRDGPVKLDPLAGGSDYVPFFHHAGVPSLHLGFDGTGAGVYHSAYDTFAWYTKFSDGSFRYGQTFAALHALLLVRLADAPLIPFEFTWLGAALRQYTAGIRALTQHHRLTGIDWKPIEAALGRLQESGKIYEKELSAAAGRLDRGNPTALAAINQALLRTERLLLSPEGLPGRPWYRHLLYAPGRYTGYSVQTLPAVRDAVEARRKTVATAELRKATTAIAALARELQRIAALLRALE